MHDIVLSHLCRRKGVMVRGTGRTDKVSYIQSEQPVGFWLGEWVRMGGTVRCMCAVPCEWAGGVILWGWWDGDLVKGLDVWRPGVDGNIFEFGCIISRVSLI